jgi:hypothetical protein
MAGVVPAIHVFGCRGKESKTWMPETSPGMTEESAVPLLLKDGISAWP